MKVASLTALGIALAVAIFMGCAESQKKTATTGAHPQFETLCSKCHTLDRVHDAHKAMTKEQMTGVVKRMADKPGSGIDHMNINDIVKELY